MNPTGSITLNLRVRLLQRENVINLRYAAEGSQLHIQRVYSQGSNGFTVSLRPFQTEGVVNWTALLIFFAGKKFFFGYRNCTCLLEHRRVIQNSESRTPDDSILSPSLCCCLEPLTLSTSGFVKAYPPAAPDQTTGFGQSGTSFCRHHTKSCHISTHIRIHVRIRIKLYGVRSRSVKLYLNHINVNWRELGTPRNISQSLPGSQR